MKLSFVKIAFFLISSIVRNLDHKENRLKIMSLESSTHVNMMWMLSLFDIKDWRKVFIIIVVEHIVWTKIWCKETITYILLSIMKFVQYKINTKKKSILHLFRLLFFMKTTSQHLISIVLKLKNARILGHIYRENLKIIFFCEMKISTLF